MLIYISYLDISVSNNLITKVWIILCMPAVYHNPHYNTTQAQIVCLSTYAEWSMQGFQMHCGIVYYLHD